MKIPASIQQVVESFEKLPGIGPKTAQRLTFYLLHVPQGELDRMASSFSNLKKGTTICSICYSIDESDPCSICTDAKRDQSMICVVEEPLDVLALEKSGTYKGVYHVLHGKIDPLNNIGPDEIYISPLLKRAQGGGARVTENDANGLNPKPSVLSPISEVILATNPTMEGEATAMYLAKQLKMQNATVKITRIGRGLPIGADLEYADSSTLDRAMIGRQEY